MPKTFGAATDIFESSILVWNGTFFPVAGVTGAVEDGDFVVFNVSSGAFVFEATQR